MGIKLLFLSHKFYPDVGGIEVNSEVLATAFQAAGHQVRLVTWTADAGERTFPFAVVRHPTTAVLLREHRWADIVFENNPSLRLAWPTVLFGRPSVVALRTWIRRMDGRVSWQDNLKLRWLQRADAVIAVSDAVRRAHWPQAIVIGNPYRNTLFRKLPAVARTADFVFFGRLVSDKGVALAIEAFQQLVATQPVGSRLSMTIVGDGPERPRLEQVVAERNLTDCVTFTGTLQGEALVRCLNQHRFLLIPSLWEEPFGNVALEGMACGCLPIVSDGGGLPDAVGKAGLTFARGDVGALTATIQQLLADPVREQQIRDVAEDQLKAHYPDVVANRYLAVIETAFAKRN